MSETIGAQGWLDRARALKNDGWALMDLCGLDCLGLGGDVRFQVVAQLLDRRSKQRLTVHVDVDGEPPRVPSVVDVWPTANFFEREAYDMFGIEFEGHPNLTRILMPEEWEGYPLRKDYGVGKIEIDFVPQPLLQIDSPRQGISGEAGGVEVDRLGQTSVDLQDAE